MSTEILKINCLKSFSVIEFDYEVKVTDKFLVAGNIHEEIYHGLLFFDINQIPNDAIINSAVLKINIKKSDINGIKSAIYFKPLSCDYSFIKTNDNVSNYPCPMNSLKLNKDFHGCLAINILDIIKNWHSNKMKNYGLLISADRNPKTLFTLSDLNDDTCPMEPHLLIGYGNNCSEYIKKSIEVHQHFWKFEVCKTEKSPPINVELIKQGSFYINNKGTNVITAVVETGIDLLHWVKEAEININEGETKILVAKYYSKFYRIKFSSTGFSKAEVKFIGQFYT
jgi:hypothetical protein